MRLLKYLSLLFCFCSCVTNNRLEYALIQAYENRSELEKVLIYYQNDTLKLAAAQFLIENMVYHFGSNESIVSSEGETYPLNMTLFSDYKTYQEHCESLINTGYHLHRWKRKDIETVTSQYLIENIELAFKVWKKPWNSDISFADFCRYILPYRAKDEPLPTLRKELMQQYLPILEAHNVTTPLEACTIINKLLNKRLEYVNLIPMLYPTVEETYFFGKGQCNGLCNLCVSIMRSIGIPVVVDYTIWSKKDWGHNWCSVLSDGSFYCFGPGEFDPVKNKLRSEKHEKDNIPAKVYRLSFEKEKISDDMYQSFMESRFHTDVTHEYHFQTVTIKMNTDQKVDNYISQIYLCAFNNNSWKIIAEGKRTGNECCIENIAGDNVFIIADSPNGNYLRYLTCPFYTDTTGHIHEFKPDLGIQKTFTLKKIKEKTKQPHTLSYWDNNVQYFVPLNYSESGDSTQLYTNIPDNSLLKFTIPEKVLNLRVFSLENDTLRIY